LDKLFGFSTELARLVSERSGGRFQISVHAANEVVPSFAMLDAVQKQTVEMTHTFPHYSLAKDTAWALGAAFPFAVNATVGDAWLLSSRGQAAWNRFLDPYGVTSWPLGTVSGTTMGLPLTNAWWCSKEIQGVSSLKGLKVRLSAADVKVWERLGVSQNNVPGGELIPALNRGLLDCVAWFTPHDDERLGLHKVASHVYYTPGQRQQLQSMLLVNRRSLESLPDAYRELLTKAATDVQAQSAAAYSAANEAALKSLTAQGVKVKALPAAVVAAARRASRAEIDEQRANNPIFDSLLTDWVAAGGQLPPAK